MDTITQKIKTFETALIALRKDVKDDAINTIINSIMKPKIEVESCSICLEDMTNPHLLKCCNNTVCNNCGIKCNKCPFCRVIIDEEKVITEEQILINEDNDHIMEIGLENYEETDDEDEEETDDENDEEEEEVDDNLDLTANDREVIRILMGRFLMLSERIEYVNNSYPIFEGQTGRRVYRKILNEMIKNNENYISRKCVDSFKLIHPRHETGSYKLTSTLELGEYLPRQQLNKIINRDLSFEMCNLFKQIIDMAL